MRRRKGREMRATGRPASRYSGARHPEPSPPRDAAVAPDDIEPAEGERLPNAKEPRKEASDE
jgi:hypothetical protein